MRQSWSFVIVLLTTQILLAQDPKAKPLVLPQVVRGEPGDFIRIMPETTGKVVRWKALDSGIKFFPNQDLVDKRVGYVYAREPGTYRVIAWTSVGDIPTEAETCTVVIEDLSKPPPDPPKPPPGPQSSLRKAAIADGLTQDQIATIAALFEEFPKKLDSKINVKGVVDMMGTAIQAVVPNRPPNFSKELAAIFAKHPEISDNNTPMSPTVKAAYSIAFSEIVAALR